MKATDIMCLDRLTGTAGKQTAGIVYQGANSNCMVFEKTAGCQA